MRKNARKASNPARDMWTPQTCTDDATPQKDAISQHGKESEKHLSGLRAHKCKFKKFKGDPRVTVKTLSLQDTVQWAGSVHLAERLCSFSPLNP